MKKLYIEPRIKAVELDQEQATLAVCAVGGLYLNGTVSPYCGTMFGAGSRCELTPKGGPGNSSMMYFTRVERSASPS
ncbi:MAG: hypothetical protein PHQ52_03180 [Candidatus Omnitrophica bacterium]|nr:hypothetical protein [Candidatus Omnitrophota bacterium]